MMTRCEVCASLLDDDDLFCANCGTESPAHARERTAAGQSMTATHNFNCQGCGASMSYDPRAQALRCPFCGSVDLTAQPDAKVLEPRDVIPFQLNQQQAELAMRKWLGEGFWRPGRLAQEAAVVKMAPVYVPYWIFEAQTHTYWTADTSRTPPSAYGDWYPMAGEHQGNYRNVLIGASGALTPAETAAICPFNLSEALPPEQVDLNNAIYERFSVPLKYARPLLRQAVEANEAAECAERYVPPRQRNVHVNVLIAGMAAYPSLLPVWIMAYRFQDRVFRFLLNGQTGQATGKAPVSWTKIFAAIGIGLAVIFLLLVLLGIIGVVTHY